MDRKVRRRLYEGFRAAWAWTGSADAAIEGLDEVFRTAGQLPGIEDEPEAPFWQELHRHFAGKRASSPLDSQVGKFHHHPEPGRSVALLTAVAGLPLELAREIAGAPNQDAAHADVVFFESLKHIEIPDEVGDRLERLASEVRRGQGIEGTGLARNPAIAAAVVGAVLLAALAIWNLTGRAGQFPDEVVQIATTAGKATAADFSPIEAPARDIPDWFALQGLDWVKIPESLGGLDAVGVRTFRHENEIVTQVAALNGEQRVYLLSFAADPFGLNLPGASLCLCPGLSRNCAPF